MFLEKVLNSRRTPAVNQALINISRRSKFSAGIFKYTIFTILRASLAIYHLICNMHSKNNCSIFQHFRDLEKYKTNKSPFTYLNFGKFSCVKKGSKFSAIYIFVLKQKYYKHNKLVFTLIFS